MAGYRTIKVQLGKTEASVYTSPRVAKALEDIVDKADLYEGVKIAQILEAVYKQGKKAGAREAIEQLERGISEAKKQVDHARPGRPKKGSRR